jgi:hypothetical protein
MIKESLNQGKAYPMNSRERTDRNLLKSERTLCSEIWEIKTSSKTKQNESVIEALRLHFRQFQINLHKLKSYSRSSKCNVLVRESSTSR